MVDYRRMGNMEQHLGNATSTTIFHQTRNLWKSPRGTVLRIEACALLAIALSFLLAAFGSCRRWSNRWIIQKGFLAANVLSISLGTYSIGLMQSSSVKSEMYPIWAVSLLTLFACVDPVTSYNSLDYKSPLSKMIFQLFLYCGYVLLMSISTISTGVGNAAISVLSAITVIKGFHRSLALVLLRRMRNVIGNLRYGKEKFALIQYGYDSEKEGFKVDLPHDIDELPSDAINILDIHLSSQEKDKLRSCYDVCYAFFLSHFLQGHFLGLRNTAATSAVFPFGTVNYKWALDVIEIELAFLYEIFFTSNAFLHYYQAKTASFWAFASLIGICFVGVAVAIPGTMTSHRTISPGPGAGTIVVDTTTADLVITLFILVSLALLQLVQLIRCWTSNWARVSFVCKYIRNQKNHITRTTSWSWWMKLKVFVVTRTNWFDKPCFPKRN